MKSIIKKAADNWSIALTLAFFIITFLFIVMSGEGIYLQTHDNLDSNIALFRMMKDAHLYWSFGTKAPFLGGLDRNFLPSDLNVFAWIFMIFPAFPAIIIGWYMKIALSIAGFVLLGRTVCKNSADRNIFIICGLIYGILPTYPTTPFGFASLPLLLAIMTRLYKMPDIRYYLVLLAYPMLSNFSAFGIFICGYILFFFIIDWIVSRKPAWRILWAFFAVAIGFIIAEWRLFYVMFFSDEETIRSAFGSQYTSAAQSLKLFADSLLKGEYASGTYFVIPVCIIYFLYLNFTYVKNREFKGMCSDGYNFISVWLIINSFIYSVDNAEWFRNLIAVSAPPLKGFALNRTVWFSPFLWYLLFMLVLCRLSVKTPLKAIAAVAALILVCIYPANYNHIRYNAEIAKAKIAGEGTDLPSYGQFYSEDLFRKIKEDIGYDGEWSVAYGMHPGILVYNGISTLDGYYPFYSTEYKDRFRRLIAPELEIDPDNMDYFDNWGGRAYVFSPDCESKKYYSIPVDESVMHIDPDAFAQMGGKYVFSMVKVANADELGLTEKGVYSLDGSDYTVFVYARY
ncbi:MAG: DUF6044 family protein [Lachnospiraceae bacterium]|nr:DUF6044 family protein [Lachnospiraceae bacterium]